MSVRLLEPAQAELDDAITWYAEQAPGLGDAFLIETLKTATIFWLWPLHTSTANPAIGAPD